MKAVSKRNRMTIGVFLCVFLAALVFIPSMTISANPAGQIPTGSIPTVTGTPVGAYVIVLQNEQGFINLRAGPSTVAFEIVGLLVAGEQAPAVGRTRGGDWIQIIYPGVSGGVAWVYIDLVDLRGLPPVVEPPPTPTPQITATIDPTLAAQFLVEAPPTRLPTFTAPPPLAQPTIPADAAVATSGRVPVGMIIIGLAVIGLVGLVISFLSGR